MEEHVSRYTYGFGIAASLTVVFNTLLMILKETNESVMHTLIALFGHHWVAQGLLNLLLFLLLGMLFSRVKRLENLSLLLLGSTLFGVLGIVLFYLLEL